VTRFLQGAVAAVSLLFAGAAFAADTPAVGSPAPAFKLQDQTRKWHSLSDYKGTSVVLYFYPKDKTPDEFTSHKAFSVLSKRETFIINPVGRIAKYYAEVNPKGHSAAVLLDFKQLMAAASKG